MLRVFHHKQRGFMRTASLLKFILAPIWLVALDAASEPRLAAAHSLGSEMKLRRVQNDRQAEYGAVDKDYAGSEHDGFPDTFTVGTTAMLEWGLLDRAGRYIDNYFGKLVRDDGSLLPTKGLVNG